MNQCSTKEDLNVVCLFSLISEIEKNRGDWIFVDERLLAKGQIPWQDKRHPLPLRIGQKQ
jgi:hypothetical protein